MEIVNRNLKRNQTLISEMFTYGFCFDILAEFKNNFQSDVYQRLRIKLDRDGTTVFMIELTDKLLNSHQNIMGKFLKFILDNHCDEEIYDTLLPVDVEKFKDWLNQNEPDGSIHSARSLEDIKRVTSKTDDEMQGLLKRYRLNYYKIF